MLALLFVGSLSVVMLLGLMPTRPAFTTEETRPALVAPEQKISEQIPKDIMKQAELERIWTTVGRRETLPRQGNNPKHIKTTGGNYGTEKNTECPSSDD
jgi:hypothetical protein